MKLFLSTSLATILYRLLLDIVYADILSPAYEYMGFINEQTSSSLSFSWLLILPAVLWSPLYIRHSSFASIVCLLLVFMAYIPQTSLFAFVPPPESYYFYWLTYWASFFIFSCILLKSPHNDASLDTITKPGICNHNEIGEQRNGKNINVILFYSLYVMFVLSVIYASSIVGFRLHINLLTVYDLRHQVAEIGMPVIIKYIYSASTIVLSFYMCYFLSIKKKRFAYFTFFLLLLSFSVGGHKSILFGTCLSLITYNFFQYRFIKWFPWCFVCLTVLAFIEQFLFSTIYTVLFIIRRVLYVPAELNYHYYQFITDSDFYMWFREGKLSLLFGKSPLDIKLANIIGEIATGSSDCCANNGLFSDAYANMGAAGCIFMPLTVCLLLYFMNKINKKTDLKLLLPLIIFLALQLISSSFFTILLTHGLIPMMLILYCYSVEKNERLVSYADNFNR